VKTAEHTDKNDKFRIKKTSRIHLINLVLLEDYPLLQLYGDNNWQEIYKYVLAQWLQLNTEHRDIKLRFVIPNCFPHTSFLWQFYGY